MSLGLIGKKIGMTRVFTDEGETVPVTVIQVEEQRVSQVKTASREGYNAIQVAVGKQHPARINRCQAGHLRKAGVEAAKKLKEFRLDKDPTEENYQNGQEISLDIFEEGQTIDVSAVTKGEGFAGTIKRYNFSRHPKTHGASAVHRKPGSIGQCQTPGRVFKGKKMPGQLGNKRRTVHNLKIIKIDHERRLLLLKGACPGAKSNYIEIKPAIKAKG